jgi:hypothetical protein
VKRGVIVVAVLSSLFLLGVIGDAFSIDEWVPYGPSIEPIEYQYWEATNGTSFLKVTIVFRTTGYNVTDWGTPLINGNITADAEVWRWTGIFLPMLTSLSHIYDLGELLEGIPYFFVLSAWGTIVKRAKVRPWDVTGDHYVGIDDLVAIAGQFGTYPGHPEWNPLYDVNADDYVGIDDIIGAAEHFGQIV